MSGYVASARIVGAEPRLARGEHTIGSADDRSRPAAGAAILIEAEDPATIRDGRLSEHWSAARERWSQLTFFLFDPDSWR